MYRFLAIAFALCLSVAAFADAVDIPVPNSFYDFEGADENVMDSGFVGNNGWLENEAATDGVVRQVGGITTTSDDPDGCIEFVGSDPNSRVRIPYNDLFNAPSYTICLWVKWSKIGWGYLWWADGDEYPTSVGDIDQRHMDMWTHASTDPAMGGVASYLNVQDGDESPLWKINGTVDAAGWDFRADDEWHLVTQTLENNNHTIIYLDGVPIADSTTDLSVVDNERMADMFLGQRPEGQHINALFDRLRIWDSVLTEEQINALFNYEGPNGGNPEAVNWVDVTRVTSNAGMPVEFALEQNYPNPFNPTTTIDYSLDKASHVSLAVYDVLGHKIASLVDGPRSIGLHSVRFDAGNLANGIYYYRLEADGRIATKKLAVVK